MTTGSTGCGTPGVTGASATVRATVAHPEVVAAALRPDDTEELRTTVADGTVVATVEREDVGGLAATVDDVLVNLRVADRVATEPFGDEAPAGEVASRDGHRSGDHSSDDRPTADATATDDTNDTDTP